MVGVTFATAEPLALALSALGLSLALDRRPVPAGLAFAGAGLTKESYLVSAVAAAAWLALAAGAVGPPLAGWAHALGLVVGGDYVPDAPVGPLGAVLLAGSLAVAVVATVLAAGLAIAATLRGRGHSQPDTG
jgi:hypothetical protein